MRSGQARDLAGRGAGERPISWTSRTLGVLAVGVGGYGIAPLTGHEVWATPMLAGGVAAATGTAVIGARSRCRAAVVDQLAQALAPLQGFGGPTPSAIRASRWSSWWTGIPTRLVISHAPVVDESATEWQNRVRKTVERRLGLEFTMTVNKRDQRHCRVVLTASPAEIAASTDPQVQAAKNVVRDILGERAQVSVELGKDNELHALDVTHGLGHRAAEARVRRAFDNKVNALVEGRWRLHWELTQGTVRIERRPVMPTSVPHIAEPLTKENRRRLPLAVDEDNRPVVWDLSMTPHMVIVGKTGRGKTVAINGIGMEAARRGFKLRICDPKRIEFLGMRTWPNVEIVATTPAEMVATIKDTHDVMMQRYDAVTRGTARPSDFDPVVLVLDEYRNFHRQVTAWWVALKSATKEKGMPSRCPVFEWVDSIAEMGRSAGVHLIIGTQRPDADFFGGSTRDNFEGRLALGPLSPQGAQMMWESTAVGVAIPRKVKGRGTGVLEDGSPGEVQVLWTPDPHWAELDQDETALALLEPLRPETVSHVACAIELGDERTIDGDELGEWARILEAQLMPATTVTATRRLSAPALGDHVARTEYGTSDVDDVVEDLADEYEGYAEEQTTAAEHVEIGDLVLYDDSLGLWAVVEAVEVDDDLVSIAWRDDEDGSGDLALSVDDALVVRRPLADVEDAAFDAETETTKERP